MGTWVITPAWVLAREGAAEGSAFCQEPVSLAWGEEEMLSAQRQQWEARGEQLRGNGRGRHLIPAATGAPPMAPCWQWAQGGPQLTRKSHFFMVLGIGSRSFD